MKLIEPSYEYWEQRDVVTHIARCARVCYANEKNTNSYEKDEALVKQALEKKQQLETIYNNTYNI